MKIKNKTIKALLLLLFIGFLFGVKQNIAQAAFDYTLLESFPGFFTAGDTMTDFPALILAIYKFAIWTVGIAGLFMLVIGGFMYMTSAGNNSTASNAKGVIQDALVGIVAVLAAYLFIYVINPDLTVMNIRFSPVGITSFGGQMGIGNANPSSADCKSDVMLAKIRLLSQGKINPCITFALLNTESGCNSNAKSGAGACGIAQLLQGTANMSCEELKNNTDISISKGITYLLGNKNKIRGDMTATGNAFNQALEDLYAAYNGGPGALAASSDCPVSGGRKNIFGYSFVKWDCDVNIGGYKETQIASSRFLASYNSCINDANIQSKLK